MWTKMKARVTFRLHPDAETASIDRITGLVLTNSQMRETEFYPNPKRISFTVRTNDVMSLLKQFEDEGFQLESDFAEVQIRPAAR